MNQQITLAALMTALALPVSAQADPWWAPAAVTAPTGAEATQLRLFGYGSVRGQYAARFTDVADENAFTLSEGQLGAAARYGDLAGALVTLEAVRSAGPESLYGVDGDALLVRFKYAFGFVRYEFGPVEARARFGMIPDAWVDASQEVYPLAGLADPLAQEAELFFASDLGATLRLGALEGMLQLRLSVTNGEGANQIEQNEGKDITAVLSLRAPPLSLFGQPLSLSLQGGYRDGSIGVGSARDHRAFAAISADHPLVGLGADLTYAYGAWGDGAVEPRAIGAWARGALQPWLGLFFRYDRLDQDLQLDDSALQRFSIGLSADALAPGANRLRVAVAYERTQYQDAAGPLPGASSALDAHALWLRVEVRAAIAPEDQR